MRKSKQTTWLMATILHSKYLQAWHDNSSITDILAPGGKLPTTNVFDFDALSS